MHPCNLHVTATPLPIKLFKGELYFHHARGTMPVTLMWRRECMCIMRYRQGIPPWTWIPNPTAVVTLVLSIILWSWWNAICDFDMCCCTLLKISSSVTICTVPLVLVFQHNSVSTVICTYEFLNLWLKGSCAKPPGSPPKFSEDFGRQHYTWSSSVCLLPESVALHGLLQVLQRVVVL